MTAAALRPRRLMPGERYSAQGASLAAA